MVRRLDGRVLMNNPHVVMLSEREPRHTRSPTLRPGAQQPSEQTVSSEAEFVSHFAASRTFTQLAPNYREITRACTLCLGPLAAAS